MGARSSRPTNETDSEQPSQRELDMLATAQRQPPAERVFVCRPAGEPRTLIFPRVRKDMCSHWSKAEAQGAALVVLRRCQGKSDITSVILAMLLREDIRISFAYTYRQPTQEELDGVAALGWRVVDPPGADPSYAYVPLATHVLGNVPLHRNPKVLMGASVASYFVTEGWLQACMAANGRVTEAQYAIKDEATEEELGFSLQRSLARNGTFPGILNGYAVAFAPDNYMSMTAFSKRRIMRGIVACAGGRWIPSGWLRIEGVPGPPSRAHPSAPGWSMSLAVQGPSREWPRGLILLVSKELMDGAEESVFRGRNPVDEFLTALAEVEANTIAGLMTLTQICDAVLTKSNPEPSRPAWLVQSEYARTIRSD